MRNAIIIFAILMVSYAANGQSRAILGANGFAQVEARGGNWINLKWNEEGSDPATATAVSLLNDQKRPMFFEDDDGMHNDAATLASSGFPSVWVNSSALWNVHVEARFGFVSNTEQIKTSTRQLRVLAWNGRSSRVIALSAAEPANPDGQHSIALKSKARVLLGEAVVVQARAHGVSSFMTTIVKGLVFAVWSDP